MRVYDTGADKIFRDMLRDEREVRDRLKSDRERAIVRAVRVNAGDGDFRFSHLAERFAASDRATIYGVLKKYGIKVTSDGRFVLPKDLT